MQGAAGRGEPTAFGDPGDLFPPWGEFPLLPGEASLGDPLWTLGEGAPGIRGLPWKWQNEYYIMLL